MNKRNIPILSPLIITVGTDIGLNLAQFIVQGNWPTWEQFYQGLISNISWGFLTGLSAFLVIFTRNIRNDLYKWREEIIQTYYKGFHALLSSGTKENFEALERLLSMGASHSRLRGVTYDFIISSLASIGKNGFVMVDATVSDYVKYIKEVVGKSNQIAMICVVRPYWFVVDQIQGVTLPPYIQNRDEFGKGEHLKYFGKDPSSRAKRYLVVDEYMIAEMLLTTYIDKYILGTGRCPICNSGATCYIHNERIDLGDTINDIPEIFWFKKEVNENMKVTLSYTLIRHIRRKVHEELDDRVYVLSPTPGIEIRFEFTNLEKGILRIRWGDQAVQLAWIDRFGVRVNPITGQEDPNYGHTFYNTFRDVLNRDDIDIKGEVKRYLELLKREVEEYFNANNVQGIHGMYSDEIKRLLVMGRDDFREIILNAIESLCTDLNSRHLLEINDNLVNFYRQNGIAKVAYIVTYDPAKPKYPVRVARWKFNWEGILNAPG
jgi:hypothetical protein